MCCFPEISYRTDVPQMLAEVLISQLYLFRCKRWRFSCKHFYVSVIMLHQGSASDEENWNACRVAENAS